MVNSFESYRHNESCAHALHNWQCDAGSGWEGSRA